MAIVNKLCIILAIGSLAKFDFLHVQLAERKEMDMKSQLRWGVTEVKKVRRDLGNSEADPEPDEAFSDQLNQLKPPSSR